MGAIGEQLGLAWTAEQDVQRLWVTSEARDEIANRMSIRALAELAGHFLLGCAHSLANLTLRLLLLNEDAAQHFLNMKKYRGAKGFPPGDDSRAAWPTLNQSLIDDLRTAAAAGKNPHLRRLADSLSEFHKSAAFQELDGRRGMDYHRRRPQSVPHSAPRSGVVETVEGLTRMTMVTARVEADAEQEGVRDAAAAALIGIAQTMGHIRELIPIAIRAEGINYIYGTSQD